MSVEVDDVWLYELILSYLKKLEAENPTLVRESPHFSNGDRKVIVQWISKLVKSFKIGVEAHHLAVFLFDFFIADHQADAQGLYLIGAACFSVACKVNDVEINVPQASKILRLAPFENVMQSCLLKSTEILVLQHFNWNVLKPTEASFLEYYAASCLAIELEFIEDLDYANNLAKYYNKWITYFREKVLLNDEFRNYKPSKVASSIVISTRISMSLCPEWPDFMIHLTGWYKSDLTVIINKLRRMELMFNVCNERKILNIFTDRLKSGLKSDLLLENYSDLYQHTNKLPDINNVNYYNPLCNSRGDVDIIDHSSVATTDDSFLHYLSSTNNNLNNLSNGNSAVKTLLKESNHHFPSNILTNENVDNFKNNSFQICSSSYFSLNMSNSESSYFNSVLPNQDVILSANNSGNQLYFANNCDYQNSCENLSTACDISLNMPSNHCTTNSLCSYQTFSENINQSTADFVNPISDSISSSSIYLMVSQNDFASKQQFHSKHSHSVVVEPSSIATRRSQNKDSLITDSLNNGYYSLKKRAPGLVINVNGGGSSYSLNLQSNFTKNMN